MLTVRTASGRWDGFAGRLLGFLEADVFDLVLDGRPVRGLRSPDAPSLWIRDYSDMLRAARYVEADVRSVVEAFAGQQAASGRVFDYVTTVPEKLPGERENWEKWVRVPVEADVEYRFVKAAFVAWQAVGARDWIEPLLPALGRALRYTMTHPWRWDAEHGLVKRPYTIDTWDFDYTAGRAPWLNFAVTDDTFWGLFHGDQSGFYEACRLLALLCREVGAREAAGGWDAVAEGVRARANALLFNGRFYTHFHKLTPVSITGVDEAEQLSLSNPMAVNRGLATPAIAAAILDEYRRRRAATTAFAEWFGIDPPFPDGVFGDAKLRGGAYINGGIFPLAGGELARAAFAHGCEAYGCATLAQYRDLVASTGEAYLWYFPDGTPASLDTSTSPDARPTDGWGASAMLYGFVEGLCGVVDRRHSFRDVECAPRWVAAGEEAAEVRVAYAASGCGFAYRFVHDPGARVIRLTLEGEADVVLHVLLPEGSRAASVRREGTALPFENRVVRQSPYADARLRLAGRAEVEIRYEAP